MGFILQPETTQIKTDMINDTMFSRQWTSRMKNSDLWEMGNNPGEP